MSKTKVSVQVDESTGRILLPGFHNNLSEAEQRLLIAENVCRDNDLHVMACLVRSLAEMIAVLGNVPLKVKEQDR